MTECHKLSVSEISARVTDYTPIHILDRIPYAKYCWEYRGGILCFVADEYDIRPSSIRHKNSYITASVAPADLYGEYGHDFCVAMAGEPQKRLVSGPTGEYWEVSLKLNRQLFHSAQQAIYFAEQEIYNKRIASRLTETLASMVSDIQQVDSDAIMRRTFYSTVHCPPSWACSTFGRIAVLRGAAIL